MTGRPRTFFLDRTADPSGVSGVGRVAWGVLFPDGHVAVRWIDRVASSTAIWDSIGDVERVHGHSGTTVVTWLEDAAAADMQHAISHWHDEAADELARLRTGLTQLCADSRAVNAAVPVSLLYELLEAC